MQNQNFDANGDNSLRPIAYLIRKYAPYWPLLLILLAISLTTTFVILRYMTPLYESSAKILLKDEKKGLGEASILESLDLFGSSKIVENEIEVIKSINLLRKVVDNLQLYAPIFYEGKIKDVSAYHYSPVILEVKDRDSIRETQNIYFKYDSTAHMVKVGSYTLPLGVWTSTSYGTLRFLTNKNYESPPEEKPLYFSLLSPYKTTHNLLNRLRVEASSKQSTIVYLKLEDAIPKRSESILNEIINVYEKASIDDKNVLAANTLFFVNERLSFLEKELDSVEYRLQSYRNQHNIVDISQQGKLYLESAEKSDEQISKSEVQLAVLDEVQRYVLGERESQGIIPSTLGVTDPILSELLNRLYTAESKYAALVGTTAENNPILLSLQREIDLLRPKIVQTIQLQKRGLEVSSAKIGSERNKHESVLNKIPQRERELLQISRQQSIKNSIYTFLLQKREETALSVASTASDSRLVDNAHSSIFPVSPNKRLAVTLAVLFAIVALVIFVSVREVFNTTIAHRSEIDSYTQLPVLGEVFNIKEFADGPPVTDKRSVVAEQFRQIRTSLSYIGVSKTNNKILVTSSISGEGKSFVSVNLALTLANANRKVLLIELDLRRPKCSEMLGVSNRRGITNYLIGESHVDDLIQKSEINNSLYILPSGPVPPNPVELIMNGNLHKLLQRLQSEYDFIVIDTAPVKPVTDAYVLSPFADATLYVIRSGVTPKDCIQNLDKSNKLGGLKNMALIFNGVKRNLIKGYGQSYDYTYYTAEQKKSVLSS